MLVEPDLGEGEVVVVEQQQVRPRQADQLRHLGARADDVDLDTADPLETALGAVVEPDRDAVRAQDRGDPGR